MSILRKLAGLAGEDKNSGTNKAEQSKAINEVNHQEQKHCSQCNSAIAESDKFCGGCGEEIVKSENIKFSKVPAVIATIFLLLTFMDWDSYGYYTFMKFIVTGVMIYYAYYIYTEVKKVDYWFWVLIGIAVLFNPIIPIYLKDKTLWGIIDVLVVVFLVGVVVKFGRNYK